MSKYLVETYYTCSFKVKHYLDNIDENEISGLEKREDGKFEILDVKLDNRKTKSLDKNSKNISVESKDSKEIDLIYKENTPKTYFLAIILGGSLGNLFDRYYYTAVPDFIDLSYKGYHWFIFNVADIFITLGIICLIFDELFNYKKLNDKK